MSFCRQYMAMLSQQLLALKNTEDAARLLQTTPLTLMRLRFQKPYLSFNIQKQNGRPRLIEAPKEELKSLLKRLTLHLQCTYFFCRTPAAYGFVQQPRHANKKKNILTNARLHCGKKFLLNIDLANFFHPVTHQKIVALFETAPFCFNRELSGFLAELVTYKNRLPMGSPASPPLSNFAAIELDTGLLQFARENGLTFSRYVDDLTFSSSFPITLSHFFAIADIVSKTGFAINYDKLSWTGEQDEKTVTGLLLKDRPCVSAAYLAEMESNLQKLKHVLELSAALEKCTLADWIKLFDPYLRGKLEFLKMVNGPRHPVVQQMYGLYYQAYNPPAFSADVYQSQFFYL